MVRIFLSYSVDGQAEASILDQCLRRAEQCEVFRFQSLAPGTLWPEEVTRSLNICDCLIALLSKHAVQSGNVFVEIERIVAVQKPVIPVYLGVARSDIRIDFAGLLHGINSEAWATVELDPDGFAKRAITQAFGYRMRPPARSERQIGAMVSTGAVVDEAFYTRRMADELFDNLVEAGGSLILLVGPLQAGKSSLLARAYRDSSKGSRRWVDIDLGAQTGHLKDVGSLLKYIIYRVESAIGQSAESLDKEHIRRAAESFPES
jgi:chloramphenicol 3-O-phosphotransferase